MNLQILRDVRKNIDLLNKHGFQAQYRFDDGGRSRAGYKGDVPDCVARATSIVLNLDYDKTLKTFQNLNFEWQKYLANKRHFAGRVNFRATQNQEFNPVLISENFRSVAFGVPTTMAHMVYEDLGFQYKSTWAKGLFISTYTDLVNYGLLPHEGSLVLKFRGHVSAVVDGVIYDTFDTRKMIVRGAFILAP